MNPIELSDDDYSPKYGTSNGAGYQRLPDIHFPLARPLTAANMTNEELEILKAEDLSAEMWGAGNVGHTIIDDEDDNAALMDRDGGGSDDEGRDRKPTNFNTAPTKYRPESKEEAAKVNEVVTKVYDEMQNYLESIPFAPQPRNMRTTLMAHQQQALHWMLKQEDKTAMMGGILADDMGVGKTVETIGLLCARTVAATLIVCPMTLIHHWKSELERHSEPGTFRVGLYYGVHRPKTLEEMKSFNVMITSYGTLSSDYKKLKKATGVEDDNLFANGGMAALGAPKGCYVYSIVWGRVVLDEAQYIKNRYSSAFRACNALPAKYRLTLSGTPIQNSLDDLFSLLKFIRFPDYAEYAEFRRHIIKPVAENKARGYRDLAELIRRSMLRRRKDQELSGKKIVDLPPVTNNVIHLDFEEGDLLFYQATEQRIMDQFNELARHGQEYVMRHYTHVLVLLLRLRQAACHPYLVAMGHMQSTEENSRNAAWDFDQLELFTEKIVEALKKARNSITNQHSGDLSDEQIMKLITERVAMGFVINSTGALCSACKRPAESPVVTPCKHIHCGACTDERRGSCGACTAPYGTAVGKPLRPATPGELYAAVNPDANFDLGAAIDAAEFAQEAGMDVDIKPVLSQLSAAQPKLTRAKTAPAHTKADHASPLAATPKLFRRTTSILDVITIDDEDDDECLLLPVAPMQPAYPSLSTPPVNIPPPYISPSPAEMPETAPQLVQSASPSAPTGSLKVTLRPFSPSQAARSPPTVIKHDMIAPSPSEAAPARATGSTGGVGGMAAFKSLPGRRAPLGGPPTAKNAVMSRNKFTDFGKFRPSVGGRTVDLPEDFEPASPGGSSHSSESATKAVSTRSPSPPVSSSSSSASYAASGPRIMAIKADEDDDALSLIPVPALPKPRAPRGSKKAKNEDDYEINSNSDVSDDGDDNGDDLADFIASEDEDSDDDWMSADTKPKKRKRDPPALAPSLSANLDTGSKETNGSAHVKKSKLLEPEPEQPHEEAPPEVPNFRITGAAARRAQQATELKRHSTKLTALLSALELLKNAGGEDKIVIYSQFVRYMDIIEVPLRNWGWKMLRLDGSLNQNQRADLLHRFDSDPACRILIISLKAGGVGINLTVANHVFLMDPWWNTAVEKQAIDRVHRIGQTKPIYITRFFVKQTVEQRILIIQSEKDKIADRALSNRRGDAPPRAGLSFAELRQLFTSSFTQKPAAEAEDDDEPNFAPNRREAIPPAPTRTLSHDQASMLDPFRPL